MSKVSITGNASGTGTFTIASPNSNTDRTLTLPDEAGTVLTSASDISSQATANVLAFQAKKSSDQSISSGVWSKVTFDQEDLDSNNCYDTSTNLFTPTIAGWYLIGGKIRFEGNGDRRLIISIWKNNAEYCRISEFSYNHTAGEHQNGGSALVYFNGSTDYAQMNAFANSDISVGWGDRTIFYGFLVRAA
jgi:hypothetical protein